MFRFSLVEMELLLHLLKASSKADVVNICQKAFTCTNVRTPSGALVKQVSTILSIEQSESLELLKALSELIKQVIYHEAFTAEAIVPLFPSGFHKQLRDLLVQIFIDHASLWRSTTLNNLVTLPKLAEFDWRVDMKVASSDISRMNTPTCILKFEVQNGEDGNMNTMFEMSKETLETMLDGLGRIRDQLNAVAKK